MREVMKWSKDYRTGEVVTEKAYKPENVKGKATIQLRDAQGNIVQEVVSENIIIPPMKEIMNPYYELTYQSLMPSVNYASGIMANTSVPASFGGILLSSDDSMEDENNWFYKGNVIGWCPRTDQNAGTDTTRGVYNPTESSYTYEDGYYHAHLVYDFGTSQGNGEFSSVWWVPEMANYKSESYPMPVKFLPYSLGYRLNNCGVYGEHRRNARGELCKYNSGYYKLLNYKNAINGLEAPNYDVNPGTGAGNRSGFYAYDNYKFSSGYDTTNFGSNITAANLRKATITFKRYSADEDEPVSVKTINVFQDCPELADCYEKLFSAGRSSATMQIYHRFTDDDGVFWGFLYCYAGSSSNSYYKFPTISNEGAVTPDSYYESYFLFGYDVKNMAWVVKPGLTYDSLYMPNKQTDIRSYNVYDKIKVGHKKYLTTFNGGGLVMYDFAAMTCKCMTPNRLSLSGQDISGSRVWYCFADYGIVISDSSTQGIKMVRGYNAHTKLPNKVTKTSADTMKIQYDYYIQIPYAFTDDDNYIPSLT